MPDFKKQHYLPKVYLRQFSQDPEHKFIFRIGRSSATMVPLSGQCQKDYFYSKVKATESERYFCNLESVYGGLIDEVLGGKQLPAEKLYMLFLLSLDFYARNLKFEVSDEENEYYQFYLHRTRVIKDVILGFPGFEISSEQMCREVLRKWDFRVISFPPDVGILTSDCPSTLLGSSVAKDDVKGVIMPLTPKLCFVAAERATYRISSRVGIESDSAKISINQVANAINSVYFLHDVDEKTIAWVQEKMTTRNRLEQPDNGWMYEIIDYNEQPQKLSFLECI